MAKTITSGLNTHIHQQCTTLARCWKIVRTDGTTFTFTSLDRPLTISGFSPVDGTYIATEGFQNTAIDNKSDMSVDNLDVIGIFDDSSITIEDLRAGLFDYATIYFFLVNWADTTQGPLRLRRGTLGECRSSPQGFFQVELRGMTQVLQQQIIELYGPECRADLFDARCGLNVADYKCTGHVTTVTDTTHVIIALDTTAANYVSEDSWFKFGLLQFTSGQNNGKTVEVKSWNHTTNAIEFYLAAGYPVAPSDTFNITPGCDKTLATCRDKFNNILNMRAEPYLPGNDATFTYPDANGP